MIQNYTPFCHIKQIYVYTDILNKLKVLTNIINDKNVEISVKDTFCLILAF